MKRLLVYCEGPTEESFVKEVLAPYLWDFNVNVSPKAADGVSKYSVIRKELLRLCKNDITAMITTMLDYYGLPSETPGISNAKGSLYDKICYIESAVESDLNKVDNIIFNLSVHEYEGFLFSQPYAFESIANERQIVILDNICNCFETPEHINDSYDTSPSKRLINIIPGYQKVTDGTRIAQRIGIDGISRKCKHFERWIAKLTAWAKDGVL